MDVGPRGLPLGDWGEQVLAEQESKAGYLAGLSPAGRPLAPIYA